jgi:hypothetical protein
LLAICILALSVWEVEIARFGRMYAPFQALFAWYAVFFVEYTVDRKSRALAPMLVLSVIGVLVWEGGAMLAAANLLPPFLQRPSGRLTRRDLIYLLAAGALFVPVYWFATADLRTLGAQILPIDYNPIDSGPSPSRLDAGVEPWRTLGGHPGWLIAAVIPVGAALYALRWVWLRFRERPLALGGLALVLIAALPHQFLLAGALLLLLLLAGLIEWPQISPSVAAPVYAALLACLAFWAAFGLYASDWLLQPQSALHRAFLLIYEFVRTPDVVRQVIVPWAHSLPALGAALALLIGAAIVRTIFRDAQSMTTERVLLFLLVTLLLAASASPTPRQETRYVFFLYPIAIVLALTTVSKASQALLGAGGRAIAATALLCLGGFALSEDFRPAHLRDIDSESVNFRVGMRPGEAEQYPARSDIRSAASWLAAHVQPGRDEVINAFPGVEFYYPHTDFFFMDANDSRFEGWSCRAGTVERWGNRPLIHSVKMLDSALPPGRRVWLVIETSRRDPLLRQLASADPAVQQQLAWVSRKPNISIVMLTRSGSLNL